ncbi:MAG: methionyl-tRNA formyltransferase [Clostridiales bacterium]|nr:methionyl-tRNA formyltransferase [Clostridia bacterium]MCR4882639.1 methionyl-tRNA formyltransferase [Clostridiales bacterium]
MRIVFMGTPDFAVPSLKALLESGYEVVGVFTQPDRPKGRGKKLMPSPVKQVALEHQIPVFQPEKIRRDGVDDLQQLHPDLCVTAAFGQILSQEILDIPVLGTVNVHASLLPKHRGSAPIAWAILQGDPEIGVTTMMTSRGIDDGDMLLHCSMPRPLDATCGELTEILSREGAKLLIETLRKMEDGTLKRIPQDHANMTYDPMLKKEMGTIDWNASADEIVCRILAMNPWPACSVQYGEERIKLLRAEAVSDTGIPGNILYAEPDTGLVIGCGKGAVRITQMQAPGGKPMHSRDYLRGHAMRVGTSLQETAENA